MTDTAEKREQSIMAIVEVMRPLLTEAGIVGVSITGIVRVEENAVSPFGVTLGVGPYAVQLVGELVASFVDGTMERVEERRIMVDMPKKN